MISGEKFMEASSLNYRENLRNQIEEAYCKVVYTYTAHINQAKRIQTVQRRLKWIEIICSALPTCSFLIIIAGASPVCSFVASIIGGLCSLGAIALTLYFKDMYLVENEKRQRHFDTSNRLWSICEDYISLLTDFDQLELIDICNKREQLKNLVAQIYTEAPITDDSSYELARKSLKENEAQFFTQKEINQMLPQNLRHT